MKTITEYIASFPELEGYDGEVRERGNMKKRRMEMKENLKAGVEAKLRVWCLYNDAESFLKINHALADKAGDCAEGHTTEKGYYFRVGDEFFSHEEFKGGFSKRQQEIAG